MACRSDAGKALMKAVLSSSAVVFVVVAKAVDVAGAVAAAVVLLGAVVPAAAVAAFCTAAARACCSIRCWARSSSWICGGRAAKNSGLISALEAAAAAAEAVALLALAAPGAFVVVLLLSALAVAAGTALAGIGRFLMSMPWFRSCSMMTSLRRESGRAPRKDGSMPSF